ncbi:putative D-lactate dehydrogenase [cytochrome] 1, mitochondrial (putative) [Rhodotorula toruloides]|uniref:D-lactate dehydrogenase (cytochrome) n=1 Tax=Rhodotorula toruloides TaxID=5286 RepID=A0A0K3CBV1_RHOTO|nr:putative D-lactate dehydrogenase [cytochrome] 1, mitochondrial (putative) [Rhodotorula toruloides]PRQ76217.1 FAD-linked oxidase-like protein [Rhodotorula toruloides]
MAARATAQRRLASVSSQLAPAVAPPAPDWNGALEALQSVFPPEQFSLDLPTREKYGTGWGSLLPPAPPAAILHAVRTEDVVEVVRIATRFGIVLIPTGGRTALEGQFQASCCNPPAGERWTGVGNDEEDERPRDGKKRETARTERPTIQVSLSRMNKVLAVHEQDFQAVVQPGIGWQGLNEFLAKKGIKLFFPVDPAPGSEFGGMAGVAGSGTNAVGYGTLRAEWIQSMEVVLMNGDVIRTRGTNRARKSSTGWDTGRLFLGSEGTLGIITELTVRLAPVLPLKVALTSFPTISSAVSSVVSILTSGLSPTSLELLDGTSIRGLNLARILPEELREEPTVLMRFSNASEEVNRQDLEKVKGIVRENGGRELRVARDERENEELWKARKSQYWSQQLLVGEGCRTLITDICVPISRLAEFISRSDSYVSTSGLYAPIVAHIGDGNVHRAILWKGREGETKPPRAVEELAGKLVRLAQELEGTCAGEHGIGLTKRKYLRAELGEGTLALMRTVKRALDPLNLLNPDKVLFPKGEEEWDA